MHALLTIPQFALTSSTAACFRPAAATHSGFSCKTTQTPFTLKFVILSWSRSDRDLNHPAGSSSGLSLPVSLKGGSKSPPGGLAHIPKCGPRLCSHLCPTWAGWAQEKMWSLVDLNALTGNYRNTVRRVLVEPQVVRQQNKRLDWDEKTVIGLDSFLCPFHWPLPTANTLPSLCFMIQDLWLPYNAWIFPNWSQQFCSPLPPACSWMDNLPPEGFKNAVIPSNMSEV